MFGQSQRRPWTNNAEPAFHNRSYQASPLTFATQPSARDIAPAGRECAPTLAQSRQSCSNSNTRIKATPRWFTLWEKRCEQCGDCAVRQSPGGRSRWRSDCPSRHGIRQARCRTLFSYSYSAGHCQNQHNDQQYAHDASRRVERRPKPIPSCARSLSVAAAFLPNGSVMFGGARSLLCHPVGRPCGTTGELPGIRRPEPLFLPPPLSRFTVAQARRSASCWDTPRVS